MTLIGHPSDVIVKLWNFNGEASPDTFKGPSSPDLQQSSRNRSPSRLLRQNTMYAFGFVASCFFSPFVRFHIHSPAISARSKRYSPSTSLDSHKCTKVITLIVTLPWHYFPTFLVYPSPFLVLDFNYFQVVLSVNSVVLSLLTGRVSYLSELQVTTRSFIRMC